MGRSMVLRSPSCIVSIFVIVGCLSICPATAAQGINSINTSAEQLNRLQREKLELEIQDLKRKAARPTLPDYLSILNEPIVSTILGLLVGGLLFGILSDRRARKAKRLERAIEFIDEIGVDLNSVLTPMFRYIRTDRGEGSDDSEQLRKQQASLLASLQRKVPQLYEKRLSIEVQVEAFLPRRSQSFPIRYHDLVRQLEFILRVLEEIAARKEIAGYVERIQNHKRLFAEKWPFADSATGRNLQQPFRELDEWVEMVWVRSRYLFFSTLRELLSSPLILRKLYRRR